MDLLHRAAAFEVGERSCDAQHAVEAAGRQAEAVDRLGDELAAGLVERGDLLQQLAVGFGVGADAVTLVAPGLDGAGLATRAATCALPSAGGGSVKSAALTAGTSMWRSMRSNSGPEMRDW